MDPLEGYREHRVEGRHPEQTRAIVEELAQMYGASPLTRFFVVEHILRPAKVNERDVLGMARAIFMWVRDRIRFANEAGEQVLTPARTLIWGFGDCDDKTALVCSLLEAVRIPWRTALLARNGAAFHILPQARIGGRWYHLEVSDRRARFDEDPRAFMKRVGLIL